jgi:hypothetical protein
MAEAISSLQVVFKLIGAMTQTTDMSSPADVLNYDRSLVYGNGTGAGQANMWWHDQRSLAGSATEDIDLAGSLTSVFGTTITFTSLKGVFVFAAAANNASNNVNVTRPASNGTTLFLAAGDGIALGPGEFFAWFTPAANGRTVTAGSADLITITNSAGTNTVTYDVFVLGEV